MKTLYLDCSMGAAGDMLTAALLELFPEKDTIIDNLNALKIPGVMYQVKNSMKCGIRGTSVSVIVNNEVEKESNYLSHEHCHHMHEHNHRSMHEIEHIVANLPVSQKVKKDVLDVYKVIAEAEGMVHGVPVSEIHFHEVGAMDAIADISAVSLLVEKLAPKQIIVSPICVGSGQVQCVHGILPVPAPATARILQGIPIYAGSINGELCTPTGAALLKHFATSYGKMPIMTIQAIGYGLGKKNFTSANFVRAFLGEAELPVEKPHNS